MQQSNLTGAVSRSPNHSHNLFWVTLLSLLVLTATISFMVIPAYLSYGPVGQSTLRP
ncbi:MAG: hypothetical protein KGQ93_13795 [Cyanobacteria bacterium REEB459]|nr:hypothetical protein [Cyanobacteria bacterium REEB459]